MGLWESEGGSGSLNIAKTHVVSVTGGEYATITLALAACSEGDTIIVYPGSYIESIVIPHNNISIIGMGAACNTTLTQVDTKVIDFGATTGGNIENFTISLTAPTTAINAIQGTTGNFQTNMCQSTLTCTQALEQADQPTIGYVSGAGTLDFNLGKVTYTHSGDTDDQGIKAPFKAGAGGEVTCYNIKQIDINGSGSGSVTAPAIVVGTGHVILKKCDIDVDDDTCTTVAGMGYIGSVTSITTEFIRNTIHVHGAANNAYGAFALLGSFRSAFNHIHVETSGVGKAYSFVNNGAGTVNSHMDDIIADDGYTGTGTINMVSSNDDGDLTVTGTSTLGKTIIEIQVFS